MMGWELKEGPEASLIRIKVKKKKPKPTQHNLYTATT